MLWHSGHWGTKLEQHYEATQKRFSSLIQPEVASFAQNLLILLSILMQETIDFSLSLAMANEIFNISAVKAENGQTPSLIPRVTFKCGFWGTILCTTISVFREQGVQLNVYSYSCFRLRTG